MASRKTQGFTLIELMVTIAILAIVLAIAIPNFTDWLNKKRVEGVANEFTALIQLARSESIKRNTPVYLLASRTNDNTWSLMSSSNAVTCTPLTACDLRNMLPANYSKIQITSISDKLNTTKINSIDSLFTFKDNATTKQSVTFQSNNYQLRAEITSTGLTSLCIPTGKPVIAGYNTCG